MAERTTRSELDSLLGYLAGACGRTVGYGIGEWSLDNNPVYGGYVIVEILNVGRAETHPFGDRRRSPREMADCMRFASSAIANHDNTRG